eukprot:4288854-Amphidinium_carterae.1
MPAQPHAQSTSYPDILTYASTLNQAPITPKPDSLPYASTCPTLPAFALSQVRADLCPSHTQNTPNQTDFVAPCQARGL